MKIRDTMLPVLRPVGGEEEINAVAESIRSGWWGKGPKVAHLKKLLLSWLVLSMLLQ